MSDRGREADPSEGALLQFVGADDWAGLLEFGIERRHGAGSVLLRQGEPGTHVLAVLRGVTKVFRHEREGEVTLLAFRGPGELLGEVAVLDDGVRSASVETISDCLLAVVNKADFLRFVTERNLFPTLVRYALTRLRESDQARGGGDVLTRLAATLVRLADISSGPASREPGSQRALGGRAFELALTRNELAQHLGTSRNTITAALAELEDQQVYACRKRIVINDLPALRRTATELRA